VNLWCTVVKVRLATGRVDILGPVPAEYDAIIVGGGHNGLATAAYLGRAGLTTLVLERRDVLGGAAVSEHASWGCFDFRMKGEGFDAGGGAV